MTFKGEKSEGGIDVEAESEARFNGDHWVLESHISEADPIAQAMVKRLTEAGWTEDEIGQFDVAISEAVTNAIIHGNFGIERKEDETSDAYRDRFTAADESPENVKKVTIGIALSTDSVTVTVEDEGKKLIDRDVLPDPTAPEGLLKPGGRGMRTILNRCDEVDLSVPGKVVMKKYKRTGDELV